MNGTWDRWNTHLLFPVVHANGYAMRAVLVTRSTQGVERGCFWRIDRRATAVSADWFGIVWGECCDTPEAARDACIAEITRRVLVGEFRLADVSFAR